VTHVLVTGGAGYIGSHASNALASACYAPITYDDLSLAEAHVKALAALDHADGLRAETSELGVGSLWRIIQASQRVSGRAVPLLKGHRRPGDPAALYADASGARTQLGWRQHLSDLDTIIETAWRWRNSRRAPGDPRLLSAMSEPA
jgi:UDP-glucose 4-epimerase